MRNFGRKRRYRLKPSATESAREYIRDTVDELNGRDRHQDSDFTLSGSLNEPYVRINGRRLRIRPA